MPFFRLSILVAVFVVSNHAQSQEVGADEWPWNPSPSPPTISYDEDMALTYASMAVASFCGYPHLPDGRLIEAWQCGPACDRVPDMQEVRPIRTPAFNNAFAFVARRHTRTSTECVVSFRGTDNLAGWISDLESGRSVRLSEYGIPCEWEGRHCRVGYGFINNYADMRDYILGNLTDLGCQGRKVSVAGHSLGAAHAMVALYDLRSQGYSVSDSYTFGSPRVGDSAFVNALNASLAGEARVFRVTHSKDPVPHLPFEIMGFKHLSREVYYDADTTDGFIICDGSGEDRICANQWFNVPDLVAACVLAEQVGGHCDHMTYMSGSLPYTMGPESCAVPEGLWPEDWSPPEDLGPEVIS